MQELDILYRSYAFNEDAKLPELTIQYGDYSYWEKILLPNADTDLAYWKKQLQGDLLPLQLPTDSPRPGLPSVNGDLERAMFPKGLTAKLKALSRKEGVTLFMMMLAAFQVLMYRYTGQEDIIVGTPIANRNRRQTQALVGFFVNTLPLRTDLSGNPTSREVLRRVKRVALEAYSHSEVPLTTLVEELAPMRTLSYSPIFQVMFEMTNRAGQSSSIGGLKVTPLELHNGTSEFDMTMIVIEEGDGLRVAIEYNTDLFRKSTVERLLKQFRVLLNSVVNDEEQPIGTLDILSEVERRQLLEDFNDTTVEYPHEKTIPQLFEEQAARTPDRVAVVCNEDQFTYRELNARANRLAQVLRARGVHSEVIVGIMVHRSVELVVGILAILKAGGAYLPIDSEYPQDRIRYVLEDSGASFVLVDRDLPFDGFEGIVMDITREIWYQGGGQNMDSGITARNLAYVIYTSGSTGRPKGVMVEHRSVVNLVSSFSKAISWARKSLFAAVTPISFDIALMETIFPVLCGFRSIIIVDPRNMDELRTEIEKCGANIIQLTPSRLRGLMESEGVMPLFERMDVILVGGEDLPSNLREKIRGWTGPSIYNVYGPTETTVWSSIAQVNVAEASIGHPIDNTKIHILNDNNVLQPIGVPGELCISGAGVARGYLGQPELTAEKFVANPWVPGERMYRTGDLARWLPDGNIEFLGRIDTQVKIRGYRIELGEIEVQLQQYSGVRNAVVAAQGDEAGENFLCAYVVADREISGGELRKYLAERLPSYMVPAFYVSLDRIPLNVNGKVDRKALPRPDKPAGLETEYVGPRDVVEQELVGIWQEVLGLETAIGIRNNFFELGGHSLKILQLGKKLEERYRVTMEFGDLFKYVTIESLARQISWHTTRAPNGVGFFPLNGSKTSASVFAFPPITGLGVVYLMLAKSLTETTLYVTNVGQDPIDVKAYVSEMIHITSEPFTILGYSAGGILAYEVTKALERKGLRVDRLVIIDTDLRLSYTSDDWAEEKGFYDDWLKVLRPDLRGPVFSRLQEYYQFLSPVKVRDPVSANIILVTSANTKPHTTEDWSQLTLGEFLVVSGEGIHTEVIHTEQTCLELGQVLDNRPRQFS